MRNLSGTAAPWHVPAMPTNHGTGCHPGCLVVRKNGSASARTRHCRPRGIGVMNAIAPCALLPNRDCGKNGKAFQREADSGMGAPWNAPGMGVRKNPCDRAQDVRIQACSRAGGPEMTARLRCQPVSGMGPPHNGVRKQSSAGCVMTAPCQWPRQNCGALTIGMCRAAPGSQSCQSPKSPMS